MADTIQATCNTLNSFVEYLATLRISEVRQYMEFFGIQHAEVLGCLIVVILIQFTKFTVVLFLAIFLAYAIFYMWDTFFPNLSEFGKRSMGAFRNVHNTANLPPFDFDWDMRPAPGERVITPKGIVPNANRMMMPGMLSRRNLKNLKSFTQQTEENQKKRKNPFDLRCRPLSEAKDLRAQHFQREFLNAAVSRDPLYARPPNNPGMGMIPSVSKNANEFRKQRHEHSKRVEDSNGGYRNLPASRDPHDTRKNSHREYRHLSESRDETRKYRHEHSDRGDPSHRYHRQLSESRALYDAQKHRHERSERGESTQQEHRRITADPIDSHDTKKHHQQNPQSMELAHSQPETTERRHESNPQESKSQESKTLDNLKMRTSQIPTTSGGGEVNKISSPPGMLIVSSGTENIKKEPNMTSNTHRQRLPNVTSGESRRTTKSREDPRRLPVVTSEEMGEVRRIPKLTSGNMISRWLRPGEARDPRTSSRRNLHTSGGESRFYNFLDRTHTSRRSEAHKASEQRPRTPRQSYKPDESRGQKQRRSISRNVTNSRQFPLEHLERLKMQNRIYQSRNMESHAAAVLQKQNLARLGRFSNPASDRTLPANRENNSGNHHHKEKRDYSKYLRPSKPKDSDNRSRSPRINPPHP